MAPRLGKLLTLDPDHSRSGNLHVVLVDWQGAFVASMDLVLAQDYHDWDPMVFVETRCVREEPLPDPRV